MIYGGLCAADRLGFTQYRKVNQTVVQQFQE